MNIINTTKKLTLFLAILVIYSESRIFAQDIHFTQFYGAPLVMNPALTGSYNGLARVTGIYRNQWSSVTTPFVTFGGSLDAPLFKDVAIDDYLAAGLAMYNDRSGDGNLANLSILGSIAYHKFLGTESNKSLSVGLMGGYTQKSIDIARLYWEDEFFNGGFQPGTTGELLNPKTKYFTANAGINWQHRIGENFSYSIGFAGHNLNQPRESFLKKQNNQVGLGMRINSQIGVIWDAGRVSIRPALLYQTQTAATELIAGSEFLYRIGDPDIRSVATGVFAGGWIRTGDAALITAGIEFQGFRIGFAYDYNISDLNVASGGNGGFEISFRYIQPSPLDFAKRIVFPCSRF